MNILFLTTHFNTGGITSYILTLGKTLVKSGHKVLVVSSGGDCVPRAELSGMRHVKIDIRTKSEASPKLWLNWGAIDHLIRQEGIDIIHAQTRVTQVLGTALSCSTGVKMVTTCHGFFRPRWFRKTFPCWGSAVIAISKPVARHLSADLKVDPSMVHLVPNGIDLDRFSVADEQKRRGMRQQSGLGDGPLIGIIARLSDVKGINILIKAMPIILKEVPSANLLIAGQGPEGPALKKLTEDLSLTARVHFKDTVDQTPQLLAGLDVFVMPSLMEGLGLSVMEAQACGVPVVASSVGGLVDLIEDGRSGYLVAVNDPAALADRIIKVLKAPHQARSMAGQARANIDQYFSAQIMLKGTLKVYEQYSSR